MRKKNLVLTGFRGCGKKDFGKALGELTGIPFADIDTEVEFVLGESTHDFVERKGWQVYREIEQKVTHDFCRNFSGIVATGEGTIENSKNLENLKKTGHFVFVNPNFSDIKKRLIEGDKELKRDRLNPEIPLSQELDQLWQQRKNIYQAIADTEINPDIKLPYLKEAEQCIPALTAALPKAPPKRKVTVLGSTRGSTLQGVFEAQRKGRIPNVSFELFITDQKDSGALEKAKKFGVKHCEVIEADKKESREEYDRKLINVMRKQNPDVILLMGWMRILSPLYCEQFGNITLNVHPSLLPKYAGLMNLDVHQKVLENEERYTGCTIHKVTSEVDGGENVLQRKLLVDHDETPETLQKRVQKQEVLAFCEVLEKR